MDEDEEAAPCYINPSLIVSGPAAPSSTSVSSSALKHDDNSEDGRSPKPPYPPKNHPKYGNLMKFNLSIQMKKREHSLLKAEEAILEQISRLQAEELHLKQIIQKYEPPRDKAASPTAESFGS